MASSISAKTILSNPIHFLAFGFGSGLSPIAPGTFGTLAAIPIYLLFSHVGLVAYIALTVFVTLIGIWICGESSRLLGVHDHGGIVWDEIAGYLITMLFAPAGWIWLVIGFVLFRLFDIWKPYPIRWIDKKVSGGLGIMLDDVLAGIYALIVLQGIYYFFPGL
jgi:phosphatidylglycerophosphatase A